MAEKLNHQHVWAPTRPLRFIRIEINKNKKRSSMCQVIQVGGGILWQVVRPSVACFTTVLTSKNKAK